MYPHIQSHSSRNEDTPLFAAGFFIIEQLYSITTGPDGFPRVRNAGTGEYKFTQDDMDRLYSDLKTSIDGD
jgi:hypothetical protein